MSLIYTPLAQIPSWTTVVGAGATLALSIVASSSKATSVLCTSSTPQPLSAPQSALILASWILALCSMDALQNTWQTQKQARHKKAFLAASHTQYAAVLRELVDRGMLSHMMRNPHSRILPWIMVRQKLGDA